MDLTLSMPTLYLTAVCIVFYWVIKHLLLRNRLKTIPSRPSYPFLGDLLVMNKASSTDIYQVMARLSEYGMKPGGRGLSITWLGTLPMLNIRKPEHIKSVLTNSRLISKSFLYTHVKDYIGEGVFNSKADKWPYQRKMLTPAFHSQLIGGFIEIMLRRTESLNENIAQSLKACPNEAIDIHQLVLGSTLETLCETLLGANELPAGHDYFKRCAKLISIMIKRTIVPWYSIDFLFYKTNLGREYKGHVDYLKDFSLKIIHQRRAERANSKSEQYSTGKKHKMFLDLLLDEGENPIDPLSLEDIHSQVDTFIFAGHDLTAASVMWALFALGNNLEVQEKVHKEIEEVFGDNCDDTITQQQLGRLEYLDRVVKEGFRMYPPAPFIARTLTEDTVIDGVVMPKHTGVSIYIHLMHNDPEIWDSPEKFEPDRFLPENSRARDPYAYIPFSAGPRNCIGQKFGFAHVKIMLATILRKWRIRSLLRPEQIRFKWLVTMTSEDGIKLFFSPKKCNKLLNGQ